MNKRWKETKKKVKDSPVLFEDEEVGTSSSDEVRTNKLLATPQSKLTGHSTPIRTKIKTDSSDSPEIVYNESPIEPLTQNPPNEVGWDYQRPIGKEDDVKITDSMDISRTPKRNILLSKKRNSNSPLLYKPLKKKLIQEEQNEVVTGFLAELRAIEINAKKIGEKNTVSPQKTEPEQESQLIVEMDSQPSDESDIKLQVSANTDESPGQSKTTVTNKNYDALLDDSIEDIMVMCSQEVEAKEFAMQKAQNFIHPQQYSSNTSRENSSSRTSLNSSSEKVLSNKSKENVQPSNGNILNDTSSKHSSSSKTESGSLEIPDDSLDDLFVEIDDNEIMKSANTEILIDSVNKSVKYSNKFSTKSNSNTSTSTTTSKSSATQNKFFQSKGLSVVQTKDAISATKNNCVKNNQSSNTSVSIQNKIVNAKANYGYLNKNFVTDNSSKINLKSVNTHTNDKSNETRLFKAKSFSDSNFLHQSSASNNFGYRSHSNLNMNSGIQQKPQHQNSVYQNSESSYYSCTSESENKSWRRVQSSSSISKSNESTQSIQQSNKLNGRGASQLFTPAEIERKRQEALMKREAKLKSQLTNQQVKRPTHNSVKR